MIGWVLLIVAVTFAVLNTAFHAATNTWTPLAFLNLPIAIGGSLFLFIKRHEWMR